MTPPSPTVDSLTSHLTNWTVLYSFQGSNDRCSPTGRLSDSYRGLMYGTSRGDGCNSNGALYSFNLTDSTLTVLHQFTNANLDGRYPQGSPVVGGDGLLWGATYFGGAYQNLNNWNTNSGYGIVYTYNLDSNVFTTVYSFTPNPHDGRYPAGSLLAAPDHMLYGVTWNGGSDDCGVIYRVNPVNKHVDILFEFIGSYTGPVVTGNNPTGQLVWSPNQLLFGVTQYGGSVSGLGTIYSFDPKLGLFTLIHAFKSVEGYAPTSFSYPIQFGLDGRLFGYTQGGGDLQLGGVFALTLDPTTQTVTSNSLLQYIHSFTGRLGPTPPYDGTTGLAEIYIDPNDPYTIFGTTHDGGLTSFGTVFMHRVTSKFQFTVQFLLNFRPCLSPCRSC